MRKLKLKTRKSCNEIQPVRNPTIHMKTTGHEPALAFGDFVRNTRVRNNITGRDASSAAGILPSNLSKIEHGVLTPPRDPAKVKALAVAIGIQPDSEDAKRFFDLAAEATDSVPVDIKELLSSDTAMPLLLRTIGNRRLTAEEIRKIIELVQNS
jgi:transcriptional regulator with XRE-family HTH domain